jgi:hypothetical protein
MVRALDDGAFMANDDTQAAARERTSVHLPWNSCSSVYC